MLWMQTVFQGHTDVSSDNTCLILTALKEKAYFEQAALPVDLTPS